MIYSKTDFRKKMNEFLDEGYYEEACFVIIEGLSLLAEIDKEQDDFSDDELIDLMEDV